MQMLLPQETLSQRIKWFLKKYVFACGLNQGFCRLKSLKKKATGVAFFSQLGDLDYLIGFWRAKKINMDPASYLERSFFYPFFWRMNVLVANKKSQLEVQGQRFAVNHLAALFVPAT